MTNEYLAHHCVNQLMNLLKAENGNAAQYTEFLLRNRTPFNTTQVDTHEASVQIIEKAPKPKEFTQKLELLKLKNARNLDPTIYLLSQLIEKPHLKKMLSMCARDRGDADKLISKLLPLKQGDTPLPSSGTELSTQELQQLRNSLEQATVRSHSTSIEAIRKKLNERQREGRHVHIPTHPDWWSGPRRRPFLTNDFPFDTSTQIATSSPLGNLGPRMQEREMLVDLLHVLVGCEGKYILVRRDVNDRKARKYILDTTMDVSVMETTNLILPMATSYSIITGFIEERCMFEYGLVNHALCSAMKSILHEHRINVARLEEELLREDRLSLQRLVFTLQPAADQMEEVAAVCVSVERGSSSGAAILSLLHNKIASAIGDKSKEQLFTYLAQRANIPYLEMLEKWIYKGEIDDCYGEFMVEEDIKYGKEKLQDEYNDFYWQSRYTLCRERIPNYLEPVADRILSCGKYLNVVRECGRAINSSNNKQIVYHPIKKDFIDQIDQVHGEASKVLLKLLLDDHHLWARLRSLKSYFILNDGDFLLTFMDLTETEMKMDADDIAGNRLKALLELSLRTSMSDSDPYKDDLKIKLLPYDLITQLVRIISIDTIDEKVVRGMDPNELNLSGLESVALDYEVKWPLSLVISRKSLTEYQMLFRHLHYCKYVERHLSRVWSSFKHTKKTFLNSRPWSKRAMSLLQRLLYFVRNYEDYMMNEVLEPNWQRLESDIKKARNLDEVLNYHSDFLRQSLQDCLLTNKDLLRRQSKLLFICVSFCSHMLDLHRDGGLRSRDKLEYSTLQGVPTSQDRIHETQRIQTTHQQTDMDMDDLATKARAQVEKMEAEFNKHFTDLLHNVERLSHEQGQHCLVNMLDKMDFNEYYRSMMKADQQAAASE